MGSILSSAVVSAWTGPSGTASTGNVAAPLNVGPIDQIKSGGLGINSLAVFGNAIFSGPNAYLNFGNAAGSGGYGIRDNVGTLEFKNTGGGWNTFTNSVLNVIGAGAVTQIKFSDGTTQTTAPVAAAVLTCVSVSGAGQYAYCPAGYIATGCNAGQYNGSVSVYDWGCWSQVASQDWTSARCCRVH